MKQKKSIFQFFTDIDDCITLPAQPLANKTLAALSNLNTKVTIENEHNFSFSLVSGKPSYFTLETQAKQIIDKRVLPAQAICVSGNTGADMVFLDANAKPKEIFHYDVKEQNAQRALEQIEQIKFHIRSEHWPHMKEQVNATHEKFDLLYTVFPGYVPTNALRLWVRDEGKWKQGTENDFAFLKEKEKYTPSAAQIKKTIQECIAQRPAFFDPLEVKVILHSDAVDVVPNPVNGSAIHKGLAVYTINKANKGILMSKKDAVKLVKKYCTIDEQVYLSNHEEELVLGVSAGDGENDIEMLRATVFSIIPEKSKGKLSQYATTITSNNHEDIFHSAENIFEYIRGELK